MTIVEIARRDGLALIHDGHMPRRSFTQSPASAADLLESRAWSWCWGLSDDVWAAEVVPAIDALRAASRARTSAAALDRMALRRAGGRRAEPADGRVRGRQSSRRQEPAGAPNGLADVLLGGELERVSVDSHRSSPSDARDVLLPDVESPAGTAGRRARAPVRACSPAPARRPRAATPRRATA